MTSSANQSQHFQLRTSMKCKAINCSVRQWDIHFDWCQRGLVILQFGCGWIESSVEINWLQSHMTSCFLTRSALGYYLIENGECWISTNVFASPRFLTFGYLDCCNKIITFSSTNVQSSVELNEASWTCKLHSRSVFKDGKVSARPFNEREPLLTRRGQISCIISLSNHLRVCCQLNAHIEQSRNWKFPVNWWIREIKSNRIIFVRQLMRSIAN